MRWWGDLSERARVLAAGVAILAVYVTLSLAMDPNGSLGTDTGAKVATLRAMEASGQLSPDVGYWAEEWDPDGSLHPLYQSKRAGDQWVQVTTLPMLYAGYPLWRLGGYRAALLLPMLGSVAAAFAARALARRFSGGDGWAAFWVVGLASPMAIYALDFWEHSVGVALGAWALVLLVDVVERGGLAKALAAGALFGAAATMRTEALVYAAVAVTVACFGLLWRRRSVLAPLTAGVAAAAGLLIPIMVNNAAERTVLDVSLRAERAAGTLAAGGAEGGSRVAEAAVTGISLHPGFGARSYVLGALLVFLLAFAAHRATRPRPDLGPVSIALGGAVVLYVVRFSDGLGFVSGMVAAAPVAAAGFVLAWSRRPGRLAVAAALLALPVVWAYQFTGGAGPQWGGRYILLTGLIGTAVGVAGLTAAPRQVRFTFFALAAAVTVFGLAWMVERTHQVGDAGEALARRPEPVLVSRVGHLAREVGSYYGNQRWLTAIGTEGEREAVEVLEAAGIDEFGLITLPGQEVGPIPGWRRAGADRVNLFDGIDLTVTTLRRGGDRG